MVQSVQRMVGGWVKRFKIRLKKLVGTDIIYSFSIGFERNHYYYFATIPRPLMIPQRSNHVRQPLANPFQAHHLTLLPLNTQINSSLQIPDQNSKLTIVYSIV
jgi:hypothetical protein